MSHLVDGQSRSACGFYPQAGQGVLLGVCAALQSLSAHGPLLLVLDGVDCLEADEDDEEDGEYDTGLLDGHGGGGGGGGRLTAARLSAAAEAVAMPAPLDGPDGGRVAAAAAEGEGEPAGPGGVARSQDAALALAEVRGRGWRLAGRCCTSACPLCAPPPTHSVVVY